MFSRFLKENNVELHLIATDMSRENGQVERIMRHIFNLLRSTLNSEKETEWATYLFQVEETINATVHSVTKVTPHQLMYGENPRLESTKIFFGELPIKTPGTAVNEDDIWSRLNERNNERRQEFNKKRLAAKLFAVGNLVAVENTQLTDGNKLGRPYKGPRKIMKLLPNERYVLSAESRRTTVAAHAQLHAWPVETIESTTSEKQEEPVLPTE